jgi:CDP-4-dehydro-6-deoxyglucose reductase
MFEVKLKNGKRFSCDSGSTIFEAAKASGILLEHSCLTARCRSCVVRVLEGETEDRVEELVLSDEEKSEKYTLSCNAIPKSNISLDAEDLGDVIIYEKKIFPTKIKTIDKVTDTIAKVTLRFPPTAKFNYTSGQYVNLIKGNIKRSYSIANKPSEKNLTVDFLIKNYENGLMSNYWFEGAKENDLIRLEGPLGSFFYRESETKNIIFLATGTGIAPVKAILEEMDSSHEKYAQKNIYVIVGTRYEEEFLWSPDVESMGLNITFIPVLSRPNEQWKGEKGYVQDILMKREIDLKNAQVYACGSNSMIEDARELLIKNSLNKNAFYSDAFICTN